MNYIYLLKQRNKTLVISGQEGIGKSLLSNQLANDDVNVTISSSDLHRDFTNWLEDKPSVVIIDVEDRRDDVFVQGKVKQFMSSDEIRVNVQYKESYLIPTPFFILNVNCDLSAFNDSRHFTVIKLGECHE